MKKKRSLLWGVCFLFIMATGVNAETVEGLFNTDGASILSDNSAELLINVDGSVSSGGTPTITQGDILITILGINTIGPTTIGAGTINPTYDELTAIAAVKIASGPTNVKTNVQGLLYGAYEGVPLTAADAAYFNWATGEISLTGTGTDFTFNTQPGLSNNGILVGLMYEDSLNDYTRIYGIQQGLDSVTNGVYRFALGLESSNSDVLQVRAVLDIGDFNLLGPLEQLAGSSIYVDGTVIDQNWPNIYFNDQFTAGNGGFARPDSTSEWPVYDNIDFTFFAAAPCIDLEKEVSVDGGTTWFDADLLADAPVTGIAAMYRLIVENCGDIPLTNVTLTDIEPSSTNPPSETIQFIVTIDDLQPGDRKVIEAFLIADIDPDGNYSNPTSIDGFGNLNAPDRCFDPWQSVDGSSEGEYLNTAKVTTNEGVSDDDPAWVICEEQQAGSCRMTGGSVTVNEFIDEDGVTRVFYTYVEDTYADALDGKINAGTLKKADDGTITWVTTGGQIGAPSTDNNPKNGHWTHTQHAGAEGIFTFLSGTASAPEGTEISNIDCADPGWCVQARCAPFKQIFWDGIGYFPNVHKGEAFAASFPDTECEVIPGQAGTMHYYHAMVGDFGENDRKNRQPDNSECDWPSPSSYNVDEAISINAVLDDQFGDKGGQVCSKCADYYQIQIFCGATEATKGNVIYTFEDHIDGGNFQLHPETSEQCTVERF